MDEDFSEEIARRKHFISSSTALGSNFVALYRSQLNTDVTLVVQSREFKVHRLILSTRSKYFNDLFTTFPSRSRIELNETFDLGTFDRLLEFIYGGKIEINGATDIKELVKLERTAKRLYLNLGKAFETKKRWLEEIDQPLRSTNAVSMLKRTFFLNKKPQFDLCMQFVADIITDLSGHPEMLLLPFEIVLALVSKAYRKPSMEEYFVIYLFCWYSAQKEEGVEEFILTKQMRQLFKHIKLEYIDLRKKMDVLRPKDWVSAEELWSSHVSQVEVYRQMTAEQW